MAILILHPQTHPTIIECDLHYTCISMMNHIVHMFVCYTGYDIISVITFYHIIKYIMNPRSNCHSFRPPGPASGCQLGAARLFTSCCRSSFQVIGDPPGNPCGSPRNVANLAIKDVEFICGVHVHILKSHNTSEYHVFRSSDLDTLTIRLRYYGLAKQTWTGWTKLTCCKIHEHQNIYIYICILCI